MYFGTWLSGKPVVLTLLTFNPFFVIKTKKLLLSVGGALILGIGAYLNFAQAKTEVQISDLTLANIEAMALNGFIDLDDGLGGGLGDGLGWGGSNSYTICYYSSRVKVGYTYYDCQKCTKETDEMGKRNPSKCY